MTYLLIPSCDVKRFNSLSGTSTEKRLEEGLRLWRGNSFDKLIVTGSVCHPTSIQSVPAGILMRDWLIQKGVRSMDILWDVRSRDTYQDIEDALLLTEDDANREISVVSHWQHTLRFWITSRLGYGEGFKVIPMFYWFGLKTFVQEWAFLLIHLLDRRGDSRLIVKNRERRLHT